MVEAPAMAPDETITWVVHPGRDEPLKCLVVALCAIAVLAEGLFGFRNVPLGVVGFIMVLAATAEYWLGTRYTLTAASATSRCGFSVSVMEWSAVRRVLETSMGVRLSPLEHASRLDAFRGVALKLLPENRDCVLRFIASHCHEDVRVLGSRAD